MRLLPCLAVLLALLAAATTAAARPRHPPAPAMHVSADERYRPMLRAEPANATRERVSTRRHAWERVGHRTASAVALEGHPLFGWSSTGLDRRPHAWCGWYARHHLVSVDPGPAFNLARNWARWGSAAAPGPGVMVVWRHHIGKITGPCRGHICVVTSGNDARAVRTRERSVAGAIAFRL